VNTTSNAARWAVLTALIATALAALALLVSPVVSAVGTERVSVDSAEAQATMDSVSPAISAHGRYVAFESRAPNLVAGDTNGVRDIFVRDRVSGTTERVSVDDSEVQGDDDSLNPTISADGRYVAFESRATNLVSGDTNTNRDIFVRDRQLGVTERVSIDSSEAQADGNSEDAAISADGQFVAFTSVAANLVGSDANASADIFIRDRQAGVTERVSVSSAEVEANGASDAPAPSGDGRYVAYSSVATNLVPSDTNLFGDIFVRDRQSGTTERVSVSSAELESNFESLTPSISTDGRFVAFQSHGSNLVASDTNADPDVFVRDRTDGTTDRASVDSAEVQGDSVSGGPSISDSGRSVAFFSYSTNLVAGDTNSAIDVFVRHRIAGTTERLSVDSAGAEANGDSADSAISGNGRMVAFHSGATNLAAGDTNSVFDVFARAPDSDGDGDADDADNCPNWPNPTQALPTWSVPAGDSDCDGFPDTVNASGRGNEAFMATDRFSQCSANSTPNNEPVDAWPPDFNDTRNVNLSDVSLLSPLYNLDSNDAGYLQRFDLNANNSINLSDVSLISTFYNKSCTP